MRVLVLSLLWIVLLCVHTVVLAADQSLVETVRKFVRDSLANREFELVLADNATCSEDLADLDKEQLHVLSRIDMCASPDYQLRELSPAQVSWKREDASAPQSEDAAADTSSHVVHDYLIFALVMRNNPHSMQIISMLHSAATMFPGVAIVFGDALKFQNFCAQYGIHSLPSVQLFKKGMLHKRYRGKRTAADFAAFLTRYTGEPIRAVPQAFAASNTGSKPFWEEKWGHSPKTWFDKALFVSKLFVVTPSTEWRFWSRRTESVASFTEFVLELLHSDLWLLAALTFVFLRMIYAYHKKPDRPGS
jgi:hypothetical protein